MEILSNENRTFKRLCVAILIIGVLLRIFSVHWNQYVHGDVFLYSKAAESLANRGDFFIPTDITQPYFYSLQEKGGRFLEHNPLWPLMGSAEVSMFHISGYEALKILSLLAGMLLLFFMYRFAFLVGGESVAFLSLVLAALSYPLIDYSGNGSFYIFQADLYLLFLILLPKIEGIKHQLFMGIILGLSFLLNQQTIILFISYFLYLFIWYRREPLKIFRFVCTPLVCAVILFIPWGIRNQFLFGSPFHSIAYASTYLWNKLGVLRVIKDGVISFSVTTGDYLRLLKSSLLFYLPHNAYYIHRKLFLLAPIAYAGSLFLVIESLFTANRRKINKKIFLPAVLVVLFHSILSALYPDLKFRYLIPILPIVFIFGSFYIVEYITVARLRTWAIGFSIAFATILFFFTYYSTPAHTDYYDGTITTDIFNKNGENEFLKTYSEQTEWSAD